MIVSPARKSVIESFPASTTELLIQIHRKIRRLCIGNCLSVSGRVSTNLPIHMRRSGEGWSRMKNKRTERKARLRLTEKRDAHRTHAKMRFFERLGLSYGPAQLREIEQMIAKSKAILVGRRPQVRNYLVAIEGRLVPIGYNTYSKRVVTALPEAAMEEIDPELISLARFTLLKVENDELIISKIRDGEAELV